jgi:hypothetical protein
LALFTSTPAHQLNHPPPPAALPEDFWLLVSRMKEMTQRRLAVFTPAPILLLRQPSYKHP